jgi:hypothetical protein
VSKLVEVNHVPLGGDVGSVDWAYPYLDDEHAQYATRMLLLGRKRCEAPVKGSPRLRLVRLERFRSEVVLLAYWPDSAEPSWTGPNEAR